jgi:hypothetical protein
MLRERHGKYGSSVVACCDKCKAECPESRQHATDIEAAIGWNGSLAIATAKRQGFIEKLEGRMHRLICPACAKTLIVLMALAALSAAAGCKSHVQFTVHHDTPYGSAAASYVASN